MEIIEEPGDPCGPSIRGYWGPLHEGFLHWTGDGSHLVFDQADTLWTLDVVVGSMRMIVDTDANSDAQSPEDRGTLYGFYADVSPDGSQIVYSSCEFELWMPRGTQYTDGYELVMMNIDGTGKTKLTGNNNLDHYPVWSPDGRHIVFVRYRGGLGPEEYSINPDERIHVQLAIRPSGEHGPGTPLATTNNVALYPPVWSPDGQTIAYMVDEGEWDPELAVWTIGANGAEPVRIGRVQIRIGRVQIGNAVSPPTWSPDGEELAFVTANGSEVVVYAARPDGTGLRRVWRGLGEYGRVHWSPDGWRYSSSPSMPTS